MKRIVVGIDGSAESKQALRWAAAEAKLRGAVLRVVHTWFFPYIAAGPGPDPVLDAEVIENVRRTAEQLVDSELAELGGETSGIDIERAVVEGAPAPALLEAAEGAALLVVGSRGRGGFTGLLLGSVSQQCAHHAPCPLVIVPPNER
jgi:nucleotide-binding universal stress UspA family protein